MLTYARIYFYNICILVAGIKIYSTEDIQEDSQLNIPYQLHQVKEQTLLVC